MAESHKSRLRILVRSDRGAVELGRVGAGVTINPASLPAGTQGVAYNQTLTTSGGSGGNVFSVGAGSLPPGLSLSSGGVINGTQSQTVRGGLRAAF